MEKGNEKRVLEVVAGLIRSKDRFLACQRPADKARALLWEFPGGKVEPGESGPEALVREIREELGVTLCVGGEYMDVMHEYPELIVHLTLYESTIAQGEIQKLEHNAVRWMTADEIDDYAFCPADQVFCAELKRRG